uniref:Uncharacterized protein n=1 Tax=Arundo donax TaxID=35708 RepID=A0A0A9AGW5_ARUDO
MTCRPRECSNLCPQPSNRVERNLVERLLLFC